MDEATLVRMANQIASFFASQPHDEAVQGIAGHVRSFWEPRMRRGLCAIVDAGRAGLDPLVMEAVAALRNSDQVAGRN